MPTNYPPFAPQVTVTRHTHHTVTRTDYPCPCGRGVIEVTDCTVHATAYDDTYALPQQTRPCGHCGADDPDPEMAG